MTTIHHAGVCVRDMPAALRFYRDGLGLTVIVDKVLPGDMHALLGVHTNSVHMIFLNDTTHPDSGIVELLDLGIADIADADPQAGVPARGAFLLSFQLDVETVLSRLDELQLGGPPRRLPTPDGGTAATVVDPDGVMVELLPMGRLSVMK